MANITLPSNPVNGQTVVIGTRLFQYDSTSQRWKSRVFQVLGDTSVTVTNEAPTITASLSEIALDTSGANVSFTYTVSDVDSSVLKVSHSVSGIANSDLATVTHHRANNTVTITAGTEAFTGGQITLTVTDGRNNATDTIDVSAAYGWVLDLSTLSAVEIQSYSTPGGYYSSFGITQKPDGKTTFTTHSDAKLYEWSHSYLTLSPNPTLVRSVSFTGNPRRSVRFKPDGTILYLLGDSLSQYNLSTPWDISNLPTPTTYTYTDVTDPQTFEFSKDGTKMYLSNGVTENDPSTSYYIRQYTLSTPWDVTTATYSNKKTPNDAFGGKMVEGMTINPSGEYLYTVTRDSNDKTVLRRNSLGTPFEIDTVISAGQSMIFYSNINNYAKDLCIIDGVAPFVASQDSIKRLGLQFNPVDPNP